MAKKLGKFWWAGFTLSALTSASALVTHLALEPIAAHKTEQERELFEFGSYKAWWPDTGFDDAHSCEIYESCVFLGVEETKKCNLGINVRFITTDEDDLYLGEYSRAISRLDFQNRQPIEVGSDDPRVSFFEIIDIKCGDTVENTIREI
jgi:hypothetical protein